MHAPAQVRPDANDGLSQHHYQMPSAAALEGQDLPDPAMAKWVADNLPHGARVLDAGCGQGLNVVALHNGLPARLTGKSFIVYASDYREDLLETAMLRGAAVGVPAYRYRQATFVDLSHAADWRGHMDAVTVNFEPGTAPAEVDYEAFLQESLQGLASVVKPGGTLLACIRARVSLRKTEPATPQSFTAAFEATGLVPKLLRVREAGDYVLHTVAAVKPPQS